MVNNRNYFMHFGVPGMRWGHRKAVVSGHPTDHKVGRRKAEGVLSKRQLHRQTILNGKAKVAKLTETIKNAKVKDGGKIEEVGYHVVERMLNRRINSKQIVDSLENPLKITGTKTDDSGRVSKRYIGEKATSSVNPKSNKLATIWRTGKSKRKKYSKGGK